MTPPDASWTALPWIRTPEDPFNSTVPYAAMSVADAIAASRDVVVEATGKGATALRPDGSKMAHVDLRDGHPLLAPELPQASLREAFARMLRAAAEAPTAQRRPMQVGLIDVYAAALEIGAADDLAADGIQYVHRPATPLGPATLHLLHDQWSWTLSPTGETGLVRLRTVNGSISLETDADLTTHRIGPVDAMARLRIEATIAAGRAR